MTFGTLAGCAVAVSACGSGGGTFANKPGPPTPVNLTVYINNAARLGLPRLGRRRPGRLHRHQPGQPDRVADDPDAPGGTQALANTGPINPQATAQVTVDFQRPGDYTVATGTAAAPPRPARPPPTRSSPRAPHRASRAPAPQNAAAAAVASERVSRLPARVCAGAAEVRAALLRSSRAPHSGSSAGPGTQDPRGPALRILAARHSGSSRARHFGGFVPYHGDNGPGTPEYRPPSRGKRTGVTLTRPPQLALAQSAPCVQYLHACKQLRSVAGTALTRAPRPRRRRPPAPRQDHALAADLYASSCSCTRTATPTCSRPSARSS